MTPSQIDLLALVYYPSCVVSAVVLTLVAAMVWADRTRKAKETKI